MGELVPFVLVGIVGLLLVASVLMVGAVLVFLVVVRKRNQAYFQAYQEFLEQKNQVEKRLHKHSS